MMTYVGTAALGCPSSQARFGSALKGRGFSHFATRFHPFKYGSISLNAGDADDRISS